MRFYKLNGVWQSWDYLHNELGYAERATRPTVFKSCADATWGEDAGNGYYDGDVSDMINGTFWTDADPTGWFDLDGLVWNSSTYPADAAPSLLVKDGVASDALVITCDDGNYYLIRAIIDTTAWIPESEVEELGWRSPSFVVVDSTTGKIVSGCNQELTTYELPSVVLESDYETYELPSISLAVPKMVIGVPMSVPVIPFWFTDNGQNETIDTELVVRNGLHDADGVKVKSVDDTDYQGANVLAYMEADGDMFTSSDASFTWFGSDSLRQLFVSNQDARGKSAWSVFAAKLFHLSFVNTQLPDVTIELPAAVVDTYGTQITLPTMTGEYESGGKTWKPSAWDIGAFGSSYSLTGDVVAHLVFTEVQQYTEITLYMSVGTNLAQRNVTSAFVGNVNTSGSFTYALYTNVECTDKWEGYDYSNDYQIGHYVGGEWVRYPDSISDLPSTTTAEQSEVKWACALLDLNRLWVFCNYSPSINYSVSLNYSIVVRVTPKAQQHYAFYLGTSNAYGNTSVSNNNTSGLKGGPGISSAQTVPWGVQDATLPTRTIQKLLGSAGNEISQTGVGWRDPSLGYNYYQIANASGASISLRTVVFTLSTPTSYCYPNNTNTNATINSSTNYQMFDADGNSIPYESNATYRVIGMFKADGDASTNSWNNLNLMQLYGNASNNLCLKYTGSGSLTFYKVWYTKTIPQEIDIDVNFGDPVTIPAGYTVDSILCSRGYAFASYVNRSSLGLVSYELPGEKIYFDDTDTALIGKNVDPCLTIFAHKSIADSDGWYISCKSGITNTITSCSAQYLNSGGYFVKADVALSDNVNLANAMQIYPVHFNLSDSAGNWLYYCLRVPQTLWQFSGGVFSWLGDTTDATDLAYWYNTRAVRVHCVKI